MNNLIPNGTKVRAKTGGLEGITKGVCVRGIQNNSIEYQIGFWAHGEYKEVWLYDFEIEKVIDKSEPAGFHKPDPGIKLIENNE